MVFGRLIFSCFLSAGAVACGQNPPLPPPSPEPVDTSEASRSVLSLVDPGARQLVLGQTSAGSLGEEDWLTSNGNLIQAWSLDFSKGAALTVDLVSSDFDSYLYLVGPGIDGAIRDDDGAGACNSRITHRSVDGGTFRLIASAFSSGSGGDFTLSVSSAPGPQITGDCNIGSEAVAGETRQELLDLVPQGLMTQGELREGTLTDDQSVDERPTHGWDYQGTAGEEVSIDLMSRRFDAYLLVTGPGLSTRQDDDSGGGCNARITLTLPEDGLYRIGASAFSGAGGPYRLSVSSSEGILFDGNCPGSSAGDADELLALTTAGRQLETGSDFSGTLSEVNDPVFNGAPVQAWTLEGVANEPFNVDLVSDDFDAMLYLLGPGILGYEQNDDGAGACHSRITHTPSESGVFRVVASSILMASGDYTLRVSQSPGPSDSEACGGGGNFAGSEEETFRSLETGSRVVTIGEPLTGTLSASDRVEDRTAQAWALSAEEGDVLTLELDSDSFDAFLFVTGPGIRTILRDDDSGDQTNSRLTFTVEESGGFRVIVSAWGGEAEGAFVLRVSRN